MQKTYEVVIRATITKSYIVEAEDNDEAAEAACEMFNVNPEFDVPEDYQQEVLDSREVTV